MSGAMEDNDFSPNNTVLTRQGYYSLDDQTANAFQGCKRYPTHLGHFDGFQRRHEHNGEGLNNVVGPAYLVDRDVHGLQPHRFPNVQDDQTPMRHANEQFKHELRNASDYNFYHPLARTYPSLNAAYPTTTPYGQDGQYWDNGVFPEPRADQSDPVNSTSAVIHEQATQASKTQPDDEIHKSQPYAKLIYLALLSVPEHKMVLKDIYEWFRKHTDKARNGSTGWQNSIRHNLSMNIAFQKEEASDPTGQGKKNYVWALSKDALDKGCVESTTRFRKPITRRVSHNQQSYRVSKPSSTPTTKSSLHSYYQTPAREGYLNNEMLRVRHNLDSGGLKNPFPQRPTWQYQTPLGSFPSTVQARSNQLAPYCLPQPEAYGMISASYDRQVDTQRTLPLFPSASTMTCLQSLEHEITEAVHPTEAPELPVAERISPCPSMTVTNSSFGNHEPAEEEQYHFVHSPDLQVDVQSHGEQDYDRLHAWRALAFSSW